MLTVAPSVGSGDFSMASSGARTLNVAVSVAAYTTPAALRSSSRSSQFTRAVLVCVPRAIGAQMVTSVSKFTDSPGARSPLIVYAPATVEVIVREALRTAVVAHVLAGTVSVTLRLWAVIDPVLVTRMRKGTVVPCRFDTAGPPTPSSDLEMPTTGSGMTMRTASDGRSR